MALGVKTASRNSVQIDQAHRQASAKDLTLGDHPDARRERRTLGINRAQVSDECQYTVAMPIVNMRELSRATSRVIGAVVRTGRPAVVTKGGKPVAIVSAIDPDEMEDLLLATLPGLERSLRQADADLAAGRTVSLEDYLARSEPSAGRRSPTPKKRRVTRGG